MNAPEIARPGLEWFNVAAPLPIASLHGRVVILDFWTEGCINCIQIIPTLRRVEEKFPDKVVVIGVHSPKFANEKNAASVKDAIRRYDIRHPIVHDPEMKIWREYGVQAWPTLVVIGADGNVAGTIAGEPDPDRFVAAIDNLVADSAKAGTLKPAALDLKPLTEPKGRFLFPGKLKPVPGQEKRWVLADGGHNQIVLLDDSGNRARALRQRRSRLQDGAKNEARFNHPQGIIASSDAIFVADTESHCDSAYRSRQRRGDYSRRNRQARDATRRSGAGPHESARISLGPREERRPTFLRERRHAPNRNARSQERHCCGARGHGRGRYCVTGARQRLDSRSRADLC